MTTRDNVHYGGKVNGLRLAEQFHLGLGLVHGGRGGREVLRSKDSTLSLFFIRILVRARDNAKQWVAVDHVPIQHLRRKCVPI